MAEIGKDLLSSGGLGIDTLNQARLQQITKAMTERAQKPKAGSTEEINGTDKPRKSPEEIDSAATQFEGLLVQEMLKSMWSTVPKGDFLSGSKEEDLYRDMLNEAMASDISKGQGIGIKQVIKRELERKEK